jgi:hypothetical protein
MIQLLLVHNKFNIKDVNTYPSYPIRIFTCSKWNHLAIRINDYVYEAIGKGVIKTEYEVWKTKANRQVLPLTPKRIAPLNINAVMYAKDQPYGFFDLLDRAKAIINEKWNGEEHKSIDYPGLICSDLGCLLLNIPKTLVPGDFETKATELGLIKGSVYITYKE